MTEVLKACPFCGGEASLHVSGEFVTCAICVADGQVSAEAIAAWNTRADSRTPPSMSGVVTEEMIEAAFRELRGRKLLKYLFAEDPDDVGEYGYLSHPFEPDTQREIVSAIYLAMLSAVSGEG